MKLLEALSTLSAKERVEVHPSFEKVTGLPVCVLLRETKLLAWLSSCFRAESHFDQELKQLHKTELFRIWDTAGTGSQKADPRCFTTSERGSGQIAV